MEKDFVVFLIILSLGLVHCRTRNEPVLPGKNLYWGDIHNHCSVGYAKGSLERAYDIAQSHLDFYCFTPHSQWHDQPDQGNLERFTKAYELVRQSWGKVKQYANDAYQPGKFVSFIGYEWHSSHYGDACLILPGHNGELVYPDNMKDLKQFARDNQALLIPHHPSYLRGMRGQNWEVLGETQITPVVEIYSEHGNAESDRAPYPYIRHSMGGRYTPNTLQYLLEEGHQVGVVASTDDHLGYPGAYGEGLVAVYADTLTREGIIEAIRARRTYAVSADRIGLDFRLNGHWMGEAIPAEPSREIRVKVMGKDVIDRIEVLRNNRVICRKFPVDNPTGDSSWNKPVLCRVEFGWGPWGGFNIRQVTDWKFDIQVKHGKILSATPCFQSGPYEEDKRNIITGVNERSCQFISYTSRDEAFGEGATNSVILELLGSPETELEISLSLPTEMTYRKSLKELAASNDIFFTGGMGSGSVMIHRVVFSENYSSEFSYRDQRNSDTTDWYYVRVIQANGSMAWSSPVWLNAEN